MNAEPTDATVIHPLGAEALDFWLGSWIASWAGGGHGTAG